MGRVIKFRCWNKGKKMMYPPFSIWKTFFGDMETSELILMQYTGLKDKNGKEIYEDDLLKCDGKLSKEKNIIHNRIGKMIYGELHRGFDIVLLNKDKEWEYYSSMSYVPSSLEVTGNIYENPELLNYKLL